MSDDAGPGLVERARSAAARGDWQHAFDLLMEADGDDLLNSYRSAGAWRDRLRGRPPRCDHRDVGACLRHLHAGRRPGAAAGAAIRLAMLLDTALMAPVRGWLARAEQLLEGAPQTPAHAWFAVVRAYERMLTGDVPGARQWARRAIEVGSTCDPAACAIGRIAEARLVISNGDVQQGLALLDVVSTAALPARYHHAPCRDTRVRHRRTGPHPSRTHRRDSNTEQP